MSLRFTLETSLLPDEPSDIGSQYRVDVLRYSEAKSTNECMGHFTVYRFDLATAMDQELHIIDVFDSIDKEIYDFFEYLYDHDAEDWKESVAEGFEGHDVLYFQWAEFPESLARSTGVLAAAERIVQVLGRGCSFAALWPWEKPHPDRKSSASPESLSIWSRCDSDLFWRRIGFRRFEDTPVLVRDLSARSFPIASLLEAEE